MSDLVPAEAMERLRAQFGGRLDALSVDQRLILATAATEQVVTHARMLSICSLHPVDLSRMLQGLVQDGFLEQTGRTKAAVYRLPGTALPSPEAVFGTPGLMAEGLESRGKAPELAAKGSELPAKGSELDSEPSTPSFGRLVEGLASPLIDTLDGLDPGLREQLDAIAAGVKGRGKVAPATSRAVISELCRGRYLTIRVLSSLLDRDEDYLRQRILNPMVQDRALERAFPQAPNDPRQAYTAAGGCPMDALIVPAIRARTG